MISNVSNTQSFTLKIKNYPYYANLIIALAHLIGNINLMLWADISGVGNDAREMNARFGELYFVILNGLAMIMFFTIATVFKQNADNNKFRRVTALFAMVFISRGIGGFILVIINNIGTAEPVFEFIFSSLALSIGIVAWFNYRSGGN